MTSQIPVSWKYAWQMGFDAAVSGRPFKSFDDKLEIEHLRHQMDSIAQNDIELRAEIAALNGVPRVVWPGSIVESVGGGSVIIHT